MDMKKREFALFAMPSMVIMCLLMIVPLLVTIYLSFCTFTLGKTPQFVGLANYRNLFTSSPRLWTSTWFSLVITAVNVVYRLVVATFLAIALYYVKSKVITRVIICGALLPFSITPVVGTTMFSFLFKDIYGLIPYYLEQLGIQMSWLAEPGPARALIILHSLWGGVPFTVVTLYSGLQAMALEPLEAAEAEGANIFQKVWYIIIPYLSPLLVFNTMTTVMAVFRTYDSVAVMTKGGPGVSTETIQFYNYQVAFAQQNVGQGSAMSVLSILMIFILLAPFLYMMYREQLDK